MHTGLMNTIYNQILEVHNDCNKTAKDATLIAMKKLYHLNFAMITR